MLEKPNGLLFHEEFLLKQPNGIGGWYLGRYIDFKYLYQAIKEEHGWEWGRNEDAEHSEDPLICPMNILVWES